MLNNEFDHAFINNPDDEILIGEGEVVGEGQAEAEGSDLENNFRPTPTVGSNNPCASQYSCLNNVEDHETSFYKGITFKN